jgi:hypothetical protein
MYDRFDALHELVWQDNSWTSLHLAAFNSHLEIAQIPTSMPGTMTERFRCIEQHVLATAMTISI